MKGNFKFDSVESSLFCFWCQFCTYGVACWIVVCKFLILCNMILLHYSFYLPHKYIIFLFVEFLSLVFPLILSFLFSNAFYTFSSLSILFFKPYHSFSCFQPLLVSFCQLSFVLLSFCLSNSSVHFKYLNCVFSFSTCLCHFHTYNINI